MLSLTGTVKAVNQFSEDYEIEEFQGEAKILIENPNMGHLSISVPVPQLRFVEGLDDGAKVTIECVLQGFDWKNPSTSKEHYFNLLTLQSLRVISQDEYDSMFVDFDEEDHEHGAAPIEVVLE